MTNEKLQKLPKEFGAGFQALAVVVPFVGLLYCFLNEYTFSTHSWQENFGTVLFFLFGTMIVCGVSNLAFGWAFQIIGEMIGSMLVVLYKLLAKAQSQLPSKPQPKINIVNSFKQGFRKGYRA